MSGRKNRAAKRRSGIMVDAKAMQRSNIKNVNGEYISDGARRDKVDALLREYVKKN